MKLYHKVVFAERSWASLSALTVRGVLVIATVWKLFNIILDNVLLRLSFAKVHFRLLKDIMQVKISLSVFTAISTYRTIEQQAQHCWHFV